MPKLKRPPLKPNPFISLRDPETGKWRVIFNFTREGFAANSYKSECIKPDSFEVDSFKVDGFPSDISQKNA
ncbi:MAG: hypothetical protein AAFP20_11125 [Cyanobacteria bacterium J06614_10]